MYDKPENAVLSLSRRERVLLDPLGASKKSDNKKKKEPSESEIMQADLEPIIAPIEPEIAPIPPVEPEEFEMKSADDAPDSFGAEGELHPEEAELAELEEDFDIEAIKKAALENIVTEKPKAKSTKKGKK